MEKLPRQIGIFVGVALLAAVIWFSRHVLLLCFAALLVCLILISLANLLRRVVPVGHKIAVVIVLAALAGIATGVGFLLAPSMSEQFAELADRVPKLVKELTEKVQESSAYSKIEGAAPDLKDMAPSGGTGKMMGFFTSTFQALSSLVFILFTTLFLSFNPGTYRQMLIKLFPPARRQAAEATVSRIVCVLKYWLLGQAVSMAVVGALTWAALRMAGIPLAAALGVLGGLAEFVPIVGPIAASVPALLLALAEGGDKLMIVFGIFVGIQFFEGNVIMPLVQRQAVDLPPVVTLVSVLIMGGSFGLLGMFVAAPLAAMTMVLVEDVYLKGYLKTDDRLLE